MSSKQVYRTVHDSAYVVFISKVLWKYNYLLKSTYYLLTTHLSHGLPSDEVIPVDTKLDRGESNRSTLYDPKTYKTEVQTRRGGGGGIPPGLEVLRSVFSGRIWLLLPYPGGCFEQYFPKQVLVLKSIDNGRVWGQEKSSFLLRGHSHRLVPICDIKAATYTQYW